MSKAKITFAAFAVVLAVSAMTSNSASAAEGWLIKGTLLVGTAALATTAAVDEVGVLRWTATSISCTALSVVNPLIASPNKGSVSSLVFEGCAAQSPCSLPTGRIATLPILTEVTLDGSLALKGVFKPETGTTLATIKLEGAGCADTEKELVTGDLPWLAPTGQDERTWQLLSVNIGTAQELLLVGHTPASLVGSILLKLASSLPWSFM